MTYETIDQIKQASLDAGGTFFDDGAIEFFDSRIERAVYGGRYFVTSERRPDSDMVRRWTVREIDEHCRINTVGTFRQYATSRDAHAAARQLAETLRDAIEVALCVDCVYVDANGYDSEAVADHWTGFLDEWDGYLFGSRVDLDTGEPCEGHFSSSPCDGCGTTLGGERFDYLALLKQTGD